MRNKLNPRQEINGPKIWIMIGPLKQGPFSILEVAHEIELGKLLLSNKGSYDGIKWQALGQMPEFSSAKTAPPIRPILNGDPTCIIRISDLIAKESSSPEKKIERSQKNRNRILQGMFLATGCCVVALALTTFDQSNEKNLSNTEVKKELKKNMVKRLTSYAANEEDSKQVAQSLPSVEQEPPQEAYQEVPQDDYQDAREMNAAAKEANFTRYPASEETEFTNEDVGQQPNEE